MGFDPAEQSSIDFLSFKDKCFFLWDEDVKK